MAQVNTNIIISAIDDKPQAHTSTIISAIEEKPHVVPKYDWYTWLSGNPQHILHHVARFAASDLKEEDIPYFSHDLLSSIGIESAHDRLEILRHRDTYISRKADLAERLSEKSRTIVYGLSIKCESDVRVRVGPIIGKVTSTTAIVMIEVSLHRNLVAHLIPFDSKYPIRSKATDARKNRPKAFLIENLVPGMKYNIVFEGINAKDAHNRTGVVKTMPEGNRDVRIVALSCDSPDRLKDGETNMWNKLADQVKADEVDVVLHLGDQVYAWKEFQDAQAILRYSGHPRGTESVTSKEVEIRHLQKAIKDRLRDIYRFTWNLPGTATVLSNCSNLMIWSDNDLINDFTVAKEEGQDGIEPLMLYLAHQVYREYQRQLWDINYETEQHTDEFHYHKFGHTGIFINDIRGNRITNKGEQRPNNPLVNEKQWTAINHALSDPTLKNLLVCCEIPYLGNSPEEAKAQAAKLIFLADHWSYNDAELVRLLETVFEWREAKKGKRAAVLIGGDIHVGVYTTVKDSKTNSEMLQLTTTPISNGVSNFFPALEGKINDRFSYKHVPELKKRNYAYVTTHVEGKTAIIDAKLIVGAPVK